MFHVQFIDAYDDTLLFETNINHIPSLDWSVEYTSKGKEIAGRVTGVLQHIDLDNNTCFYSIWLKLPSRLL